MHSLDSVHFNDSIDNSATGCVRLLYPGYAAPELLSSLCIDESPALSQWSDMLARVCIVWLEIYLMAWTESCFASYQYYLTLSPFAAFWA